ncbi:chaperone, putative [Plasmodium gallinaceum]|uniref:Chaperone, putative n=1 Tax=Plasmodium gallinaceum TaxID=5849 RepID=A0A1J1H0D9_PLAGA|nr:chaperone, putative [Plasmodium gallinaceum]CRG96748.1 chaperone, putative [Plasmodium gallinaceum]
MNILKCLSLFGKHNTKKILNYQCSSSKLVKNYFMSKNNEFNNKYGEANSDNIKKIKKVKCYNCHNSIDVDLVPFFCKNCKALINVDVFKIFNIFKLFDLEETYDIDKAFLKKKFNDIQKIYHPDKNSQNTELEKINEVSSYLNNAYRTLLNDVDRALYLMEIQYNYKIPEEENMDDEEFLTEIIKINEEITSSKANIELLTKKYKEMYENYVENIKTYFKEKDFNNILNALKKLKFINRILERLQDF